MRGKLTEARAEIEKAAALAPYDDDVWVARAQVAADLGDRESANTMLTRALELNPQNREAQAMLRATP